MIYLTVGTQLSFDRLVKAVDAWAGIKEDVEVFAQIGPSTYQPKNMKYEAFLTPTKSNDMLQQADCVVAHAGMGTVITSLLNHKPLIILPRKAVFKEHRNDHQMSTAKWLADRAGIKVAWHEDELSGYLNSWQNIVNGKQMSDLADGPLVKKLDEIFRDL